MSTPKCALCGQPVTECECKEMFNDLSRELSPTDPEPESDLIGNDPLSWALQELMGLGDKFGIQIYTVSRLFAAIRTKRDRGNGVCVCNRAAQPKPDTDAFGREEVKLILSQRESYVKNHSPDGIFLATGPWLDKHYIPGLHLLPSLGSTPIASGTEGEEKTPDEIYREECERQLKAIRAVLAGESPSFDESACLAAEKKLVAYWKGKADDSNRVLDAIQNQKSAYFKNWGRVENELTAANERIASLTAERDAWKMAMAEAVCGQVQLDIGWQRMLNKHPQTPTHE